MPVFRQLSVFSSCSHLSFRDCKFKGKNSPYNNDTIWINNNKCLGNTLPLSRAIWGYRVYEYIHCTFDRSNITGYSLQTNVQINRYTIKLAYRQMGHKKANLIYFLMFQCITFHEAMAILVMATSSFVHRLKDGWKRKINDWYKILQKSRLQMYGQPILFRNPTIMSIRERLFSADKNKICVNYHHRRKYKYKAYWIQIPHKTGMIRPKKSHLQYARCFIIQHTVWQLWLLFISSKLNFV